MLAVNDIEHPKRYEDGGSAREREETGERIGERRRDERTELEEKVLNRDELIK